MKDGIFWTCKVQKNEERSKLCIHLKVWGLIPYGNSEFFSLSHTCDKTKLVFLYIWTFKLQSALFPEIALKLGQFFTSLIFLISCTNYQDIQYQSFVFVYITFFFIRVLQNLTQINIINSQKALGDLNSAAHVQQAAIWQIYGKK